MRLSVGPSPAAKGISTFVAVVFIAAGFCFAGMAFGMGSFFESAAGSGSGSEVDTPAAFGWVAKLTGLCGVPFVLIAFFLLLHTWRFQMRLDGDVLTRRGALGIRRADMTTAEVAMAGFNYTQRISHDRRAVYRVPALAVTDPATGRSIKVPLRGQGLDLLPPNQLRALADVLDRNRSSDPQRARGIAAHLRELASDPVAY